jgi:hypothetical protein
MELIYDNKRREASSRLNLNKISLKKEVAALTLYRYAHLNAPNGRSDGKRGTRNGGPVGT